MSENENLDGNTNTNQGRPTFLTVLCILTFIGSGLAILGGLFSLLGIGALSSFSNVAGGSMIWVILGLIASVLCLFGAIQMWSLKKQGFTLYLSGSLLSIIVTIISTIVASSSTSSALSSMNQSNSEDLNRFSDAASGMASGMLWAGAIFGIVITIVFVLMYNANRKHLVN